MDKSKHSRPDVKARRLLRHKQNSAPSKHKGKTQQRKHREDTDSQSASDDDECQVVYGPPGELINGKQEYLSIKIGSNEFKLGDCAQLQNPDVDGLPFIGKVVRIYVLASKNDSTGSKAKHTAVGLLDIQWYYRPSDAKIPAAKRDPCELFESNMVDANPTEAIIGKCHVLEWSHRSGDNAKAFASQRLRTVFYCKQRFDPKTERFHRASYMSHIQPDQLSQQFPESLSDSDSEYEPSEKGENEADSAEDDDSEEEEVKDNEEDEQSGRKGVKKTLVQRRKKKGGEEAKPKRAKQTNADLVTTKRQRVQLSVPKGLTRSAPTHAIDKAKSKLHVSAVPDSLPCREGEFLEICSFVEERIRDGTSGCMFVSGVPGTGKTATIRAVAKHLVSELASGNLPGFLFVEINGMALTSPYQAYSDLWHAVSEREGKKLAPTQASELLTKLFQTPSPRRQCIVVLVDELDQLWTRKQEVMYNLFDWPGYQHSKLVVVAVANTMDLPERVLAHRVSSRLGLTRITFSPYNRDQLATIIRNRVGSLAVFHPDAIELCARKVAASSGDARRALDICRRSAELALDGAVDIKTVNQALHEMTTSPVIAAVIGSSQHERLFLRTIVNLFKKSGVEETTFGEVITQHIEQCRFMSIPAPSVTALSAVCARLGSRRILLVDPGDHDVNQRIRFNYPVDDINFALQSEPVIPVP